MFVSEELRRKNIAEYLLYMWQVEDMIRAAGLDADRLYDSLIKDSGRSAEDCRAWKAWYEDLIAMMRTEDRKESGHLQINENVIILLTDLHNRILQSGKRPEYRQMYYRALPYIVEFRTRTGERDNEELRDCFDMLYGVWMLRLQHRPVSEATAQAVQAVSAFMGMLSALYSEDKAGTLDLD
ncbi:MAG: DUF4924 family protein [Bacteroidaceae bacterium]|nr:DUF4924 family protein [Bacteroidaceae bacterium]